MHGEVWIDEKTIKAIAKAWGGGPRNGGLTIENLSERFGVSKGYIQKILKQVTIQCSSYQGL